MADADAIAVGGGLAGLVATAELADAGRRVILVDRSPGPRAGRASREQAAAEERPLQRAVAVHAPAAEARELAGGRAVAATLR